MSDTAALAEPVFGAEDRALYERLGIAAHNQTSTYNVRGYEPVSKEHRHVPAKVTGVVPTDLKGIYLRNGANRQFEKTTARLHPFNGAGMLHQIQFKDGEITYSNFFLRTPRYEAEERAGGEVYMQVGDLVAGGQLSMAKAQLVESKKASGLVPALDPLELSTASTAVHFHGGKIYCLNETAYPFALNSRLEGGNVVFDGTGKLENWGGALKSPFTAHPRIDQATNTFYNLSIHRTNHGVFYSRLENGRLVDHQLVHQQPLSEDAMAYLHDFIVTDRFLIFPDTSIRSSRLRLTSHSSIYHFDASYPLRWGVINRFPSPGEAVRWFTCDHPGFIWHMVNGWETRSKDGRDQIVLFAPMFEAYPDHLPIHSPEEPPAKFRKWVLDLESGKVVDDRVLLEGAYERPSINLAYSGKPSRYAYLLDESSGYMGRGVQKYDLLEEKPLQYLDYSGFLGGEPLFVPAEGGKDEDDGYIVDLLMKEESADLVIFTAKEMTEIARVHLPARVPFGVHACWLSTQKVAQLEHAGRP
ncbi:carotenoid oxygenase family protein [Piscinibacter sp. HJYY11]|uniref:carotenoid oxygenase family protein n=1 Tax=Piscinibacter sp. HJYY11 TaxID=2801333 RepID=UPI001920196B|nr:carotenoid oxygenase family protein [Piscinibacter sp. HJYY11]MBL0727371.1 carotenoid oxygenase family protein [Piscinibacter sp. HJYY11]